MGIFDSAVSILSGGLVKEIGGIIDSVHTSAEEKTQLKLEAEKLILQRDALLQDALKTEIESKEKIIVAEMNQSDSYTKRARPTIVYCGLFFIFLNYVLLPIIFSIMEMSGYTPPTIKLDLPTDFWVIWGGVCSVWILGRTIEKTGGKITMPWVKNGK